MNLKTTINIGGEIVDLSQPKVMGIINVTPDSFFSGSRKTNAKEALNTAERMLKAGASFLDIGGYSSRPGSKDIDEQEELDRVLEPIGLISSTFPEAIVSVDTFRSKVAWQAVDNGAKVINDISAGHLDPMMLSTVAELNVPYIAMHMRGSPQTMNTLTAYEDILKEVAKYFAKVVRDCNELGIKDVIIDPGLGFAKRADQSFKLLKDLDYLQWLEKPMLVGVSRKSMIYKTLGISADEALNGTTVLNTLALLGGANILRVHDVKEAVETIKLVDQHK